MRPEDYFDNEAMREGHSRDKDYGWGYFIAAMAAILLMIGIACVLGSCASHKDAVPTDTIYVYKTEYRDRMKIDSVYIDQWHDRYIKGDTVYIDTKSVEYRYRFATDTVKMVDTLWVTRTKVVEKEVKKCNWWLPLLFVLACGAGLIIAKYTNLLTKKL